MTPTRRMFLALLAIAALLAFAVTLLSGSWAPRAEASKPVGLSRMTDATAPVAIAGAPAHSLTSKPATYRASMTYCKPNPPYCTDWGGKAELAAVNSFTWGDRPYWIELERNGKRAEALVVSHCACHGSHGYVDVSPYVFEQIAPLSRGRVDVTVTVLDGAPDQHPDDPPADPRDDVMRDEVRDMTLPATDAL